jgi:hypothetical protein
MSVAIGLSRDYPIFSGVFTKFVTLHKNTQDLTYTYITMNRRADVRKDGHTRQKDIGTNKWM